jgi:LAS superfamily LD-carboxypeptidase LdcB
VASRALNRSAQVPNPNATAAGSGSPSVQWNTQGSADGGPYSVSYYRRDDSPNGGELYGVYNTKAQADKAVNDIKKWAADMKASHAQWGVASSSWDIAKIQVDGTPGSQPQAGTKTDTAYVRGQASQIQLSPIGDGKYLRSDAAQAFQTMQQAAKRDNIGLRVNSAFRTNAQQTREYNRYLKEKKDFQESKGKTKHPVKAARPGYSNHQNGIAVDIPVGALKFKSPIYRWLTDNAARFGFSNTEGRNAKEAWHWVYDGQTPPPTPALTPTPVPTPVPAPIPTPPFVPLP